VQPTYRAAYRGGGATLSVTERRPRNGKTILLDTAAGTTITLPAASGSGARFKFLVSVIATSNSHKIQVANASDTMTGMLMAVSDDAGFPVKGYTADATAGADTITLNRTTTGSTVKGEWIEVEDYAVNKWAVGHDRRDRHRGDPVLGGRLNGRNRSAARGESRDGRTQPA
jgi:hypothetical protein